MTTRSFFSRDCYSPIPRCATVILVVLVALVWSSPARCDEIHKSAEKGNLESVKALLKANPDLVFSKDKYGGTPLFPAAQKGRKDVAELLLANKAEVDAKDNFGMTPLHWAAADGHADVAEMLLANHAEVNAKDKNGWTPLHWAAHGDHKDVVVLLLANKAEVNAKAFGMTPSEMAASQGYRDVAELLRQHETHESTMTSATSNPQPPPVPPAPETPPQSSGPAPAQPKSAEATGSQEEGKEPGTPLYAGTTRPQSGVVTVFAPHLSVHHILVDGKWIKFHNGFQLPPGSYTVALSTVCKQQNKYGLSRLLVVLLQDSFVAAVGDTVTYRTVAGVYGNCAGAMFFHTVTDAAGAVVCRDSTRATCEHNTALPVPAPSKKKQ